MEKEGTLVPPPALWVPFALPYKWEPSPKRPRAALGGVSVLDQVEPPARVRETPAVHSPNVGAVSSLKMNRRAMSGGWVFDTLQTKRRKQNLEKTRIKQATPHEVRAITIHRPFGSALF